MPTIYKPLFILAFISHGLGAFAQQSGYQNTNAPSPSSWVFSSSVSVFQLLNSEPACGNGGLYSFLATNSTWNGDPSGNPNAYFSVPNQLNEQVIRAYIDFEIESNFYNPSTQWRLYVDGVLSPVLPVVESSLYNNSNITTHRFRQEIRFTLPSDFNVMNNAVRTYTLRMTSGDDPFDIRFRAYLVGSVFTEQLGTFTTPQQPSYILRDPPGDASYSEISNSSSRCYGQSFSVSNASGISGFAQVTIGSEFSLFGVSSSWGVTAGITASQETTNSEEKEYKTCLTTTSSFKTAQVGAPTSDLFVGSSMNYAYGIGRTTKRLDCGTITQSEGLVVSPTGSENGFTLTEDVIIETKIPEAQDLVNSLASNPSSTAYKEAVNQLAAWNDMIQMNNTLKANALAQNPQSSQQFDGGGSESEFTETMTTGSSYTMDSKVVLSNGISAEFSASVGGNSVSAGGEITFRQEVGVGSSGSNETTNSSGVTFSDDDSGDSFIVNVHKDAVFGAPVFELANSTRTSCPYEGGYQRDQPQLWVGSIGQTSMTMDNIASGGSATFPLHVCNNSNEQRTYVLRVDQQTNPLGAVISAYNSLTNSSAVEFPVPAGGCAAVGTLYLEQPNQNVTDFTDIQLTLSEGCSNSADVSDDISSSITVSAYFNGQVGIDEVNSPIGNIYPVPATDMLNVSLDMSSNWNMEVFDLFGRKVLVQNTSSDKATLDVSSLAKGEYLLRVFDDERNGTMRFSTVQ